MQNVWVICRQWDYEEFATEAAYEKYEDAKVAMDKLNKEDILGEYNFWIEQIPLVIHLGKE